MNDVKRWWKFSGEVLTEEFKGNKLTTGKSFTKKTAFELSLWERHFFSQYKINADIHLENIESYKIKIKSNY